MGVVAARGVSCAAGTYSFLCGLHRSPVIYHFHCLSCAAKQTNSFNATACSDNMYIIHPSDTQNSS